MTEEKKTKKEEEEAELSPPSDAPVNEDAENGVSSSGESESSEKKEEKSKKKEEEAKKEEESKKEEEAKKEKEEKKINFEKVDNSSFAFADGDIHNQKTEIKEQYNFHLNERKTEKKKAYIGDGADPNIASDWFESTEKESLYFGICLAIFDGLTYAKFYDLYRGLLEYFKDSEDETFEILRDNLFPKHVEIVEDIEILDEVIRFKEEEYHNAIFEKIRTSQRHRIEKLLIWLDQIIRNTFDWEIRHRAASAIYALGKNSFGRTYDRILKSWINNDRAYVRASIGYPLAYYVENPVTEDAVKEHLDFWYRKSAFERFTNFGWTLASTLKLFGFSENLEVRQWSYKQLRNLAMSRLTLGIVQAVMHTHYSWLAEGYPDEVINNFSEWLNLSETPKDWVEQTDILELKERLSRGDSFYNKNDLDLLGIRLLHRHAATIIYSEADRYFDQASDDDNEKIPPPKWLIPEIGTQGWHLWLAFGNRMVQYREKLFFEMTSLYLSYEEDQTIKNDPAALISLYIEIFNRQREGGSSQRLMKNRLNRWQKNTRKKSLSEFANSVQKELKMM